MSVLSNVYDSITQKIIAAIEAGVVTCQMPWHTQEVAIGLPSNARTRAEYRGINVLALWIEALSKGYQSGIWASYKQWHDLGAQVRAGERGTVIVFYKQIELSSLDEQDPDQSVVRRYFGRAAFVFNQAQVDGYEAHEPDSVLSPFERCEQADALLGAIGATVRHGFGMACYRRDLDEIQMPDPEAFMGTKTRSARESYYGVRFHETVHWTGAAHRLNREYGRRFGDQAYAMEELVAEIGAAFLCSGLGLSSEPRADHASYVANWLTVLKSDNRAIFTAASAAQEAYEYLFDRATNNQT